MGWTQILNATLKTSNNKIYDIVNADGTFAIVDDKIRQAVADLTRDLMTMQAMGDYAAATDAVAKMFRDAGIGDKRVRRTKELVEIVGLDPHTREILTNQVFTWSPATDEFEFSGVSYVLERIQIERNMSESDMKEEFDRRKRIIRWMVDNNIRSLADVDRIITDDGVDGEMVALLRARGVEGPRYLLACGRPHRSAQEGEVEHHEHAALITDLGPSPDGRLGPRGPFPGPLELGPITLELQRIGPLETGVLLLERASYLGYPLAGSRSFSHRRSIAKWTGST